MAFGGHARVYAPADDWVTLVRHEAAKLREAGAQPIKAACEAVMVFTFPRPKSYPKTKSRPHTSRPDATNLARAVEDALVPALLDSDSLIVRLTVLKRYCTRLPDEPSGVFVEIKEALG